MKLLASALLITLALFCVGMAFDNVVAQDPPTIPPFIPVEPTAIVEPSGPAAFYPGKGLGRGGLLDTAQLDSLGVDWWHNWSLCRDSWDGRCVHVVKSSYGMVEKGDDIHEVAAALETCQNGWIMFGDEWELQRMTMDRQIAELFWFSNLRDLINPDCKLAFGGVLVTHPQRGVIAQNWAFAFADAYQAEYGALPDVDALVLDAYLWLGQSISDWEWQTREAIAALRLVWGWDVEVWAREIGALSSHQEALRACQNLAPIAEQFDRSAWFIGRPYGANIWGNVALYNLDGNLTDLGACYRGDVLRRIYLPTVEK